MSKLILIRVDDREARNLDLLLEKYGGKAPAYFRYLLKSSYEKEFGSYKSPKFGKIRKILSTSVQELTDEQFCEAVGGRVKKHDNGTIMCFLQIPGGGAPLAVPIGARALIKNRDKQMGLI